MSEARFDRRALLRGRFLPLFLDAARGALPAAPLAPATQGLPPLLARLGADVPPAPPAHSPVAPPAFPAPPAVAPAPEVAPHTAMVDPLLCLAHRRLVCTVCIERCPVPGAILVKDGAPRVDPRVCTGCRVCQDVCPAPQNAVRLMPRLSFPPRGGPRGRP